MTTKSPTTSVRSREIIGVDQFSQRREVFDKYDTVFLPLSSPTNSVAYSEMQPVITSNHGKTTTNFKRNAPTYSSMRETRNEDHNIEFRSRKYSDNFTSELNQRDDVDYRYSMTERTRRISNLRNNFLKSNLHEYNRESAFARTSPQALVPVNSTSVINYKIESPNLYKFRFAEPYSTLPPVRRVTVDLGPSELNGEKENQDLSVKPTHTHQSLPSNDIYPKIDSQKLLDEFVKRYSPERKPVNWKLPPTMPVVVGSVPKSTSSVADSIDSGDKKRFEEVVNKSEDDVFVQSQTINRESAKVEIIIDEKDSDEEVSTEKPSKQDNLGLKPISPEIIAFEPPKHYNNISKTSLVELEDKNDKVPELTNVAKQVVNMSKKPPNDKYTDLTIPALIDKITEEGEDLESHKNDQKKVKRKRSFLDKLLGRKKK